MAWTHRWPRTVRDGEVGADRRKSRCEGGSEETGGEQECRRGGGQGRTDG